MTHCANCGKIVIPPCLPKREDAYYCDIYCVRAATNVSREDLEAIPFFERLAPVGWEDSKGFHYGPNEAA